MLALALAFIGASLCQVCLSTQPLLLGAPPPSALLTARSLGRRRRRLCDVPPAALATAPTSAFPGRICHPPTLARDHRRYDRPNDYDPVALVTAARWISNWPPPKVGALLKKEQDVDALTQYDAKGGRYPKSWQELGPRYNQ